LRRCDGRRKRVPTAGLAVPEDADDCGATELYFMRSHSQNSGRNSRMLRLEFAAQPLCHHDQIRLPVRLARLVEF
jgi:hypothetical protein